MDDIKSFNNNVDYTKKLILLPKLSKRIRNLKKVIKSEKRIVKITLEIEDLANFVEKNINKKYFKDQILLNKDRANDVYERSLGNTKRFLHFVGIIFKKDLIPLKILINKYVKIEQNLIDINEKISDVDTQLSLMKKKLLKLELDSLYNILSHRNVDFIIKEFKKINKNVRADVKYAMKAINDYEKRINRSIQAIQKLIKYYDDYLPEKLIKELKLLRRDLLKLRVDAANSRYIEGKLLAKEHVLYNITSELKSIEMRAEPINAIKIDAADTIENIGRKDDSSDNYSSQVREINKLRGTFTHQNINDTYKVINHYMRYHIMKSANDDHE